MVGFLQILSVSEMTYTVSSGTLKYHIWIIKCKNVKFDETFAEVIAKINGLQTYCLMIERLKNVCGVKYCVKCCVFKNACACNLLCNYT